MRERVTISIILWLWLICLAPASSAANAINEWTNPTRSPARHLDRLSKAQANRPPVASAGKERVAAVGEAVGFYGQGASPDQEIIEYSWDFESDGLIDFVSSKTAATTHTFIEPGEYRCLFRVKDSSGQIAQCVRRILVIPANADRQAAENALHPMTKVGVNLADGLIHRYAILFNGGGEDRFWKDVTLCYATLTNRYNFSPGDIYLLNYDGSNPTGDNPNGMIDYPATFEGLQTVVSNLATRVDSDDEVFFWITDHGRGYSGPLSQGGSVLGYLDGRASVDPGDEPDFPESDFKLRSLMTYGDYICNHGLNIWKIFRSYNGEGKAAFYRNKYVSNFDNVYVETLGAAVSDHDVFIERFVDYARGDTNKDGVIDESMGEVFDYDGDGVPPFNPATGAFDEDDWGQIDVLEDDFNHINTLLPEGAGAYKLFDSNFEGRLCIDLAYNGGPLHVDGRDEDGAGLFDWMDVNQDGDTNDVISVDEAITTYSGAIYDDDLRAMLAQLSAAKITIVAEPCFSGGLVEDLSAANRVICTASIEDAVSYGNVFIRGFVAALHGEDDYGTRVNADTDGNGTISMLEAFNYAAATDFLDEIPQYDDNGDGISHAWWSLGSDGSLGANTYLSGGTATSNFVNAWTKSTSGSWEEPYWSLGLPNSSQTVEFTNAGWKALAVRADTVNNYSNSLTVSNLTIDAPSNSFNLLLLNYAGFKAPLTVNSDLTVGTNGSLLSYYTALRGSNFYLNGSAGFSEGSTITFSNILQGWSTAAQLNLTNSSLVAGTITLSRGGALNQVGGSIDLGDLYTEQGYVHVDGGALTGQQIQIGSYDDGGTFHFDSGNLEVGELNMRAGLYQQTGGTAVISAFINTSSAYSQPSRHYLSGGILASEQMNLGASYHPANSIPFYQTGGVHSNSVMTLNGFIWRNLGAAMGCYFLDGGILASVVLTIDTGNLTQSGGTNWAQELVVLDLGNYMLNAGELVTSNTTVSSAAPIPWPPPYYQRSGVIQDGGNHAVQNKLSLVYGFYWLATGTLSAASIEVGPGSDLYLSGGQISQTGICTLGGGGLTAYGSPQQLGKIQVTTNSSLYTDGRTPYSTPPGSATTVRFQDSRDVPWTGALSVYQWRSQTNDGYGPDHIFVGTNSQGLNAAQLSQISFVNPAGWPAGSYAARMLPTGELVPAVPPPIALTNIGHVLVISWPGDYQLLTATNVSGPYSPIIGAQSPYTNTFHDPQRFFQLRDTADAP